MREEPRCFPEANKNEHDAKEEDNVPGVNTIARKMSAEVVSNNQHRNRSFQVAFEQNKGSKSHSVYSLITKHCDIFNYNPSQSTRVP